MRLYFRHHFLQIFRAADLLLDVTEGKKFGADKFAQLFGKLLLSFRKNAMKCNSEDLFWLTGVKEHFYRNPVSEPPDKC